MSNPLTITAGNRSVDSSVVPYIRSSEVRFTGYSLMGGSQAYYYFDSTKVDQFIQHPSTIVINAQDASKYKPGDGIYSNLTHGYATVLAVSPNSTIYISENYLTFNVAPYSTDILSTTTFTVGDLVYQTPNSACTTFASVTFIGSVAYWNNTDRILSVVPERGTYAFSSNTIFTIGKSTARCNVTSIVGANKFPTSSHILTTSNTRSSLVSSYSHKSGIVIGGATTTVIPIGGPANAGWPGGTANTFYITSGVGIGQSANILSVTANTITLATALSVAPTGNSRYSVGKNYVDSKGIISGIFNIPELSTVKFLTGERIFAITNKPTFADSSVTSSGVAKYVASGFLNLNDAFQTPTVSPVTPLRPAEVVTQLRPNVLDIRRRDPVAQTFFTPKPKSAKKDYGIFVSSIDLFFSKKPAATSVLYPVELRIVEVENGIPTQKIIASTFVLWQDVNVSSQPTAGYGNNQTKTNFKFSDPQYLAPDTEYAMVILSDSADYMVWYAILGGNDIVSGAGISQQPYAGSMFLSQNGSTWTPQQNWDLMFSINKAVFSTSAGTATFNIVPKKQAVFADEILLQSSDITFPASSLNYSVKGTYLNSLTLDNGNSIVPNKTLKFGNDLSSSSATSNRRRIIREGISDSMSLTVSMVTTDPDVAPVISSERLGAIVYANHINAGGIYPENISIVSAGVNHNTATNIIVTVSAPNLANGTQATANVKSVSSSNTITSINITNYGSGYSNTPTITITDTNATTNAVIAVAGETGLKGGNGIARYQTRKITLADGFDAGDLRVFVECIRPSGTHVVAYYKALSGSDESQFLDRRWVEMNLLNNINSPDQLTTIELKFAHNLDPSFGQPSGRMQYYEIGDDETIYPLGGTFKHFAIKLVLFAADPTVSPVVRTMRAIATPIDISYTK